MVPLLPREHKIVYHSIYKIKTNSDGSIEYYKARLVTKGHWQEYGMDYEETFSLVAKMKTVCTPLVVSSIQ